MIQVAAEAYLQLAFHLWGFGEFAHSISVLAIQLWGVTWLAPGALGCGKPNPINNNQNWIHLGMVHVKIGDSEIVHCWVYHSLPHQRLWKYQTKHQLQSYGPMGWDPHSPSESHYLRGASQWEDGSPPARWGLLDFMSVACSSSPLLLSSSSSSFSASSSSSCSSNCDPRSTVFSVGPQPRPSTPSVPCRTSTTTIPAQCSLPDLNHDHPRPVFPPGPQPRVSTPSVPRRTSTTTIPAQCSLPDLNHDHPRPVFPAGPQPRVSTPSVPCRTSCRKIWDKECAEESL